MQDAVVQEVETGSTKLFLDERTAPRDRAASRVFLMPTVILILVLSIFPLIFSLVLAFMSWDLSRLEGGVRFVGLQNFRTLFSDPRYWSTAKVTLIFVVGSVGLQYILGLGLALLLTRNPRPALSEVAFWCHDADPSGGGLCGRTVQQIRARQRRHPGPEGL
jgi:ABC-type polysaccharide transport system permease subunit